MKIILPDFYRYYKENNAIINLNRKFPEYFKLPTNFIMANGNYPYTISSGFFTNFNNSASYLDIEAIASNYRKLNCNLELDYSNLLLNVDNIDDAYLDFILNRHHNGNTLIEVSDDEIIALLQNKYPYFNYTITSHNQISNIEEIELLTNRDEITLFYLNPNINLDISKISNKNKIGIILNPQQCYFCEKQFECLLENNLNQTNYSIKNNIFLCKDNYNKKIILESYLKQGFTTFKIEPTISANLFLFYLDFFIKPEYIIKSLKYLWENKLI